MNDAFRVGVEQMPAGPELDDLVAAQVMGYRVQRTHRLPWSMWRGDDWMRFEDEPYSAKVGAAWRVVEKMIQRGFYPDLTYGQGRWAVRFGRAGNLDAGEDFWVSAHASAEEPAIAICRAALAAVTPEPHPPEKGPLP